MYEPKKQAFQIGVAVNTLLPIGSVLFCKIMKLFNVLFFSELIHAF